MFKKILLAEDFQDTNQGISEMLREKLQIPIIRDELYCDKAYNRLKYAVDQREPFGLLITDLFFKGDHVERKLTSGLELIQAARNLQPEIKVIVNSMEDNPSKIDALFKDQEINAYVCKGRHGLTELVRAIREVYHNRTYVSPGIDLNVSNNVFELEEFDLMILQSLAEGLTKKEISEKFKKDNITPNSESTIDKRVSKMFDEFGAKNTNHLIAKMIREEKI
ncbi:DNA-binding response regulator [Flagellimonas halotolerans]|uniref:DNA-binding response regulator n=1 Tax=Flagellimonas halotolerans TaxID=3112164 RepID=A0ABU6IP63_9FLAO|nr:MULTISPECIES: DNA-binding response regulator [unclassified Allomuricauda]MEC3965255.1 DNA-binding response regulator [Muricauda sp. SYSU M86414]MEC4264900.1 DNA-binding response regulator [Muricauda sp. SYSU M84420]